MASRLIKAGAAAAAAAAAAGALYFGVFASDPSTGFGDDPSPLSTAAIVKDGKPVPAKTVLNKAKVDSARVDFFVDGWSARTLKGTAVTAQVGTESSQVRLRPVNGNDLKELLKTTPEVVEVALARQVSGAADLTCDETGCTIDGKGIDLVNWVTNPAKVKGFGDMYSEWDVNALLYHFSVDAGDGTDAVSVSLDNGTTEPVVFPAVPLSEDKNVAPGPGNGYLSNRYVLGSAFERLFVVDPQWIRDPKKPSRYGAATPAGIPVVGDMPTRTVHHVLGLNSPWPGTEAFTDSVLTYLSSPTGGCDVGVLCTPERIDSEIKSPTHEQQRVCAMVDGERIDQIAVFDSAIITANFDRKTSQFGLWGNKSIDQFGKSAGLLKGGIPPLVKGKQTWRWDTIGLVDGSEGAVRVTAGVFTPGEAPAGNLEAVLADVTLDGTKWEPCADPDPSENPLSETEEESGNL
jgi:hypothetical protein